MSAQSITTLVRQINGLAYELAREVNGIIEPPPRDVRPLLVELAEADRECDECTRDYLGAARVTGDGYSSDEHRDRWRRCHGRRESAVEAIVRYAEAFVATKAVRR
jgi:hypothetical protein